MVRGNSNLIEWLFRALENNQAIIRAQDQKAALTFAAQALVVNGIFVVSKLINSMCPVARVLVGLLLLISLGFNLISFIYAVMAVVPRGRVKGAPPQKASRIVYAYTEQIHNPEDLKVNLNEEGLIEELLDQVFKVSYIRDKKVKYVKTSVKSLSVSILSLGVAAAIYLVGLLL